jgi:hypothetical protein
MKHYIISIAKRAHAALVDANQLANISIDHLKYSKAIATVQKLLVEVAKSENINSADKACDKLAKATDELVRMELAIRKTNLNTQLSLLGYTETTGAEINANLDNAAAVLEEADFFIFDGNRSDFLVELENYISELKQQFALMLNITSSTMMLDKTSRNTLQEVNLALANKTETFKKIKRLSIERYEDWRDLSLQVGQFEQTLGYAKHLNLNLENSTTYAKLIADAEKELKELVKEFRQLDYESVVAEVNIHSQAVKRVENMIPEMETLHAKAFIHLKISDSQNTNETALPEYLDLPGYLRVGVPAVAITLALAVILVKMRADSLKRMGSHMANAIKSGLTFMSGGSNNSAPTSFEAVSYSQVSTMESGSDIKQNLRR